MMPRPIGHITPLRTGLEEADLLAQHAVEDGLVDVLKVDVVQPVGIAASVSTGIHAGIIAMAGVEAEAGDVLRDVRGHPLDLIGEFDIAARMRMDDGAHAVFAVRASPAMALILATIPAQALSRRGARSEWPAA